jgi:hypothetical protein
MHVLLFSSPSRVFDFIGNGVGGYKTYVIAQPQPTFKQVTMRFAQRRFQG